MQSGEADAATDLLPLVYDQLKMIAVARMRREKPGNTLQATALVNEAWLRMMESAQAGMWSSRQAFFSAAAEAMRRVLVDAARRKMAVRRGGDFKRLEYDEAVFVQGGPSAEIIGVNDALEELRKDNPLTAELVSLHYFAGLSLEEAGEMLGFSRASAYREWAYARSFLRAELTE
jgi:RNA polymerase sigma factor (TIGR02999 family)